MAVKRARNIPTVKKAVWVSYDLGIKGDYEGLYTWLDGLNALECGQGLAFIHYDTTQIELKAFLRLILADLEQTVELKKSDRIYVITKDSMTQKVKGHFLHGGRKLAPWKGFAPGKEVGDVDSIE